MAIPPRHDFNAENGCIASGSCGMCETFFAFDPARVPCFPLNLAAPAGLERIISVEVDEATNTAKAPSEPVCRSCFRKINNLRARAGLPAHAEDAAMWGDA